VPTIEIYRVRIDAANVDRVLAIHDAAVAEFQQHVPELLGIELVRLDDDVCVACRGRVRCDRCSWAAARVPARRCCARCSTRIPTWPSLTRREFRSRPVTAWRRDFRGAGHDEPTVRASLRVTICRR
jgi:hypothetical protein